MVYFSPTSYLSWDRPVRISPRFLESWYRLYWQRNVDDVFRNFDTNMWHRDGRTDEQMFSNTTVGLACKLQVTNSHNNAQCELSKNNKEVVIRLYGRWQKGNEAWRRVYPSTARLKSENDIFSCILKIKDTIASRRQCQLLGTLNYGHNPLPDPVDSHAAQLHMNDLDRKIVVDTLIYFFKFVIHTLKSTHNRKNHLKWLHN